MLNEIGASGKIRENVIPDLIGDPEKFSRNWILVSNTRMTSINPE